MSKERKSVLVIDSQQDWLEFCETTLREHGYDVYTAPTVQAAQAFLTTYPDLNVTLILVDAQFLFREDGSVIAALSQSGIGSKRSVVVLFPVLLTPARVQMAYELGASDCVDKPYSATALLDLTEQMFADSRPIPVEDGSSVASSSSVVTP